MRENELIKVHSSELRQGFNPTLKKFFIEIIDIETENNIRIYLDKNEYENFGKDIFQNIEYFKDKILEMTNLTDEYFNIHWNCPKCNAEGLTLFINNQKTNNIKSNQ